MKRKKNLNFFKLLTLQKTDSTLDFHKTSNNIYILPNKTFYHLFYFIFKKSFFLFSFFNINSVSFFFFLKKNYFLNQQLFIILAKNLGVNNLNLFLEKKKKVFESLNCFLINQQIFLKTIFLLHNFFFKTFFLKKFK